jgi:uncharacterized lipoprotein NlpE involved in copper resistance
MERNVPRIIAAALCACVLGACQRHETPQPAPAAAPAASATQPAPAAEAVADGTTMAQPGVQPQDPMGDLRSLAGTWAGTLPCADCPGIDETLVLDTDGGFVMTDTYRERPGSTNVVQGTWTAESGGSRVRLDPGDKTSQDRLYAVDGDALVALGADGKRLDGSPPSRLERSH